MPLGKGHADPGEHAVDDGGRDRTEPAADLEDAGNKLNQPGEDQDRPQCRQALVTDQLEHDDGKASGGAADLQGGTGQRPHDDAADDASDQAFFRRHTRRDGDAHAQGHRHQKHDDRRGKIPRSHCQRRQFETGEAHSAASR
jgi:hypothetical protein